MTMCPDCGKVYDESEYTHCPRCYKFNPYSLNRLKFVEVSESEMFADYTADCSGSRSDCCTRVCTRNGGVSTDEDWGKFLNVEGGVIQY